MGFSRSTIALAAGLLMTLSVPGLAQDDVPVIGEGIPEGFELTILASHVEDVVPSVAAIRLDRLTLEPGSATDLLPARGPELLYVESGSVIIIDDLGLEGLYPAGTRLGLAGETTYAMRADEGPATVLRFGVPPSDAVAAPSIGEGVSAEVLLQGTAMSMPDAPARMYIAVARWDPDVDLDTRLAAGPTGILVTSGVLNVAGPSGIEGQLESGKSIILDSGLANHQRNVSGDALSTLMVGIAPVDAPIVGWPESGPPAVGGELCSADTTGGLDALTGPGWSHVDGKALFDGSDWGELSMPCQPDGLTDYAIEVEALWIRGEDSWGRLVLQARGIDEGYTGEVGFRDWDRSAFIRAFGSDGDETLVQAERPPVDEVHRYRLEVHGNALRLLVDGQTLAETKDNRYLDGSHVALFASRAQWEVTDIVVSALDGD